MVVFRITRSIDYIIVLYVQVKKICTYLEEKIISYSCIQLSYMFGFGIKAQFFFFFLNNYF